MTHTIQRGLRQPAPAGLETLAALATLTGLATLATLATLPTLPTLPILGMLSSDYDLVRILVTRELDPSYLALLVTEVLDADILGCFQPT